MGMELEYPWSFTIGNVPTGGRYNDLKTIVIIVIGNTGKMSRR